MNSFSASIPSEPAVPGRTAKATVAAGVLAFAPLACMALAMAVFLAMFADPGFPTADDGAFPSGDSFPGLPAGFYVFGALTGATALTSILAFAYFMIDAMTSPHMTGDSRGLWAIVLLLGNTIAFPVYWYVAWWRRRAR